MSLFRKTFTPSVGKLKDKEGEILDIDYRRKVDPLCRDSFGRSQLHQLLLQGYDVPDDIDYLISNGCEVNLYDSESCYPIHIAADKGLTKCTRKLIQRNSLLDVFNCNALTPLMLSSLKGFIEIASVLLQNGANPNLPNSCSKTALHYAAMGGNVESVKLILDAKGKINKIDNNKFTSLALASKLGHTDVVHLLLSYKTVPKINPDLKDSYGRTSIHWAAAAGLHDVVSVLCKAGVDLNIIDSHSATAFILAIKNNRPKVMEILLKYKIDRGTPDGLNGTCLGLASLFDHTECVKILLKAGEDPDEVSYFGGTALISAVYESALKTTEVLLDGGADPNARSRKGINALMKAVFTITPQQETNRHEIIKMLIRNGADVNCMLPKTINTSFLDNFVQGSKDIMSFSVLSGYTSIVSMLLIGGCTLGTRSWVDDIECGPLSKNGLFNVSEILVLIKQWNEQPRSLSHLTRKVIRKSLGTNPQVKIKKMSVAWKLKQYLDFEELNCIVPERVTMKGEVNLDVSTLINIPPCALDYFKGTLSFSALAPTIGMCGCEFCTTFECSN